MLLEELIDGGNNNEMPGTLRHLFIIKLAELCLVYEPV